MFTEIEIALQFAPNVLLFNHKTKLKGFLNDPTLWYTYRLLEFNAIPITISCSQRKITETRLSLPFFQGLFEGFNLSKGQKVCQHRYSGKYDILKQLPRIMINKVKYIKDWRPSTGFICIVYCRGVGVCSICMYILVLFVHLAGAFAIFIFSLALVIVYIRRLIRIIKLCWPESISWLSIVPYFILILEHVILSNSCYFIAVCDWTIHSFSKSLILKNADLTLTSKPYTFKLANWDKCHMHTYVNNFTRLKH